MGAIYQIVWRRDRDVGVFELRPLEWSPEDDAGATPASPMAEQSPAVPWTWRMPPAPMPEARRAHDDLVDSCYWPVGDERVWATAGSPIASGHPDRLTPTACGPRAVSDVRDGETSWTADGSSAAARPGGPGRCAEECAGATWWLGSAAVVAVHAAADEAGCVNVYVDGREGRARASDLDSGGGLVGAQEWAQQAFAQLGARHCVAIGYLGVTATPSAV
jgi:hypothetical protein